MPPGRRSARHAGVDTTPGKVLALALLANAPIAVGFILAPLITGDPLVGRAYAPIVLWTTPPFALLAIAFFARASPEGRAHRAARIGILLAGVSLLLWALMLTLTRSG